MIILSASLGTSRDDHALSCKQHLVVGTAFCIQLSSDCIGLGLMSHATILRGTGYRHKYSTGVRNHECLNALGQQKDDKGVQNGSHNREAFY